MNIGSEPVICYRCDSCPNTFLKVGSTPIGMSRPGKVTIDPHTLKPFTDTCPAHRRKFTNE